MQEIEQLRKSMNTDMVSDALRGVKEYAAKSCEVNPDTLQLKLMHLDEVARRSNHPDRELFASVLQRFLCHKKHEKIGYLITSLLSTAAEARLFEKEQKFLKLHGSEEIKKGECHNPPKIEDQDKQVSTLLQVVQSLVPFPRYNAPFSGFRMPTPRRNLNSGPPRPQKLFPNYTGCHKCGDLTHFKIDCPRK